ncbi:MAG: hypothetical protein JWP38_965 [Herbaspirillum sp.]|nr:hypothetical protein [Herbaspirillum sp.]
MVSNKHLKPPKELIIEAASLRQKHDYSGALSLIEDNIDAFEGVYRIQGRLQGFYAAKESGLMDKARAFALQIYEEDPAIPSVSTFLAAFCDDSGT